MTKKTKKTILYTLLLLAIGGGSVGYYMWNKPHRSVEGASGIKVAANDLYNAYNKDSAAANKQYTDKVVEVSGTVAKATTNQQNQVVVLLQTPQEGGYINCTMEGGNPNAKEGVSITVKGICSGYNGGDADLGLPGDVVLTRCYPVK